MELNFYWPQYFPKQNLLDSREATLQIEPLQLCHEEDAADEGERLCPEQGRRGAGQGIGPETDGFGGESLRVG